MNALSCPHAQSVPTCGACPLAQLPLQQQRTLKAERLQTALQHLSPRDLPISTPASEAFRERLDLRLEDGQLGFLSQQEPRSVVAITRCTIATEVLNQALTQLQHHLPPVARASLRLRAKGELKGLWIDTSHQEVKALLDEANWLKTALSQDWVLELGPKAREVVLKDDTLALVAPTLRPWSSTWVKGQETPLLTHIAGFSQPGALPNKALIAAVLSACEGAEGPIVELGAGAGNLSLALAGEGHEVKALELDTTALSTTLASQPSSLSRRILPLARSFHREADVPALLTDGGTGKPQALHTLLCDPPRSGLGSFIGGLKLLSPRMRPARIVYVSCHDEALTKDTTALAALGYRLTRLQGVDQFPWTPHIEWISIFERT